MTNDLSRARSAVTTALDSVGDRKGIRTARNLVPKRSSSGKYMGNQPAWSELSRKKYAESSGAERENLLQRLSLRRYKRLSRKLAGLHREHWYDARPLCGALLDIDARRRHAAVQVLQERPVHNGIDRFCQQCSGCPAASGIFTGRGSIFASTPVICPHTLFVC